MLFSAFARFCMKKARISPRLLLFDLPFSAFAFIAYFLPQPHPQPLSPLSPRILERAGG